MENCGDKRMTCNGAKNTKPHSLLATLGLAAVITVNANWVLADEGERDVRTAAREDAAIFTERDLPCNGSVPPDVSLYSPFQCSARGVVTFVYFEDPIPFPSPEFGHVQDGWFRPSLRADILPPDRFRLISALVRRTSHSNISCAHVVPLEEAVAIQQAVCWLTFTNNRDGTRTIFADFQDMGRWSIGGGTPLDEHEFRIYVENFALGISALH